MRRLILNILIILVVGALPAWPYSTGWGYYPVGELGTILIILLILALLGYVKSPSPRRKLPHVANPRGGSGGDLSFPLLQPSAASL